MSDSIVIGLHEWSNPPGDRWTNKMQGKFDLRGKRRGDTISEW